MGRRGRSLGKQIRAIACRRVHRQAFHRPRVVTHASASLSSLDKKKCTAKEGCVGKTTEEQSVCMKQTCTHSTKSGTLIALQCSKGNECNNLNRPPVAQRFTFDGISCSIGGRPTCRNADCIFLSTSCHQKCSCHSLLCVALKGHRQVATITP